MNTKLTNSLVLGLIAVALLVGVLVYPWLPDQIISHWNAAGRADGTLSKFWGVFLFPLIMIIMSALFIAVPRLDPLKKNFESFRKQYNLFLLVMICFFFYIFALTLLWNFGFQFNFTALIIPALAVLWYTIGVVLEHSKRNWFVGIRTPWTLSSDVVWEKTHAFGGKLFKIAAFINLGGLLLPDSSMTIFFIIIPALGIAAITIIYSYFEYKKIEHH